MRAPESGAAPLESSLALLSAPSRALVGEEVVFDASANAQAATSALSYAWDIAGVEHDTPVVRHVFAEPGFYRVSLTVDDGQQARIAWRDLYVVRDAEDPATEGSAEKWTARLAGRDGRVIFADVPDALVGRTSLQARVALYPGGAAELLFVPNAPWDATGAKHLTLWLKRQVEYYRGFEGANPVVRLYNRGGQLTLTPTNNANLLESGIPSEARWGWLRLAIPLDGNAAWLRETAGEPPLAAIECLGLQFTAVGPAPFTLWLDGLSLE